MTLSTSLSSLSLSFLSSLFLSLSLSISSKLVTPLQALIEQGVRTDALFHSLSGVCPTAAAAIPVVLFCLQRMGGAHAQSAAKCVQGAVASCGLVASTAQVNVILQ